MVIIIRENPFPFLPNGIKPLIRELVGVPEPTDHLIRCALEELSALLPEGASPQLSELHVWAHDAVMWSTCHRRARLSREYTEGKFTPILTFSPGKAYRIPSEAVSKRRHVDDSTADKLADSGRWSARGAKSSARAGQLVEGWYERSKLRAFGVPTHSHAILQDGKDHPKVMHHGSKVFRLEEEFDPIPMDRVVCVYMTIAALCRLRKYGLVAIPGLFPIDVIENRAGKPVGVVAFRQKGDVIALESIPADDLADLMTRPS